MEAFAKISPHHLIFLIYVSVKARLTNQRGQLADYVHVKGNIVYLAQGKYYEKISSRFGEM